MSTLDWLRERRRRFRLGLQRRLILKRGAFDIDWYLRRHPDVAAGGVDAPGHYLEAGHQIYFPNALFDSAWYVRRYGCAGQNPLLDYLRRGRRLGRDPNGWFDTAWYRRRHLRGRRSVDPMVHYLREGHRSGAQPSPAFAELDQKLGLTGLAASTDGQPTPLGFFLHDYRVRGWIGDCTSYFVNGWAARRAGPPISLDVIVAGVKVGQVVPRSPRPDVAATIGIDGLGYMFAFPERLRHGDVVELRDEFGQTVDGCLRTYAIPAMDAPSDLYGRRAALASVFLTGSGVEVGAFTQPVDLPPDRNIVFFDRFAIERLRQDYDPHCGRPLMEPTYCGHAQTLDSLPDTTFDFLIANHVIEHLLDPVTFLKAVASKLKPGGRAMIAAPDKRYSFDRNRAVTTFSHLVEDHERGGMQSQLAHFEEWATAVEGLSGSAAVDYARAVDLDTLIFHYHVWDAEAFIAFVEQAIRRFALPFVLLHSEGTVHEVTVILEKRERDGIGPGLRPGP